MSPWICAKCGEPILGEIVWGETAGAFHPGCKGVTIWAMPQKPAKRPPGRPPLADKDRLLVGTLRLTQAQWDKLAALGGAEWIRQKIDRAKIPTKGAENA